MESYVIRVIKVLILIKTSKLNIMIKKKILGFKFFSFFEFSENIYHSKVYFFFHYQKVEISTNKKPTDFLKKANILTREFSIEN
jgi:hypothetical protein